jgi:hypothetical protein
MATVILFWETLMLPTHELVNEHRVNAVQRTAAMIEKISKGIIGDIPPAKHDGPV